jgi:hypothetical protein
MSLTLSETGFAFQARSFFRKSLLNNIFNRSADLHQIGGGHGCRFKGLSAHSCASFPE